MGTELRYRVGLESQSRYLVFRVHYSRPASIDEVWYSLHLLARAIAPCDRGITPDALVDFFLAQLDYCQDTFEEIVVSRKFMSDGALPGLNRAIRQMSAPRISEH